MTPTIQPLYPEELSQFLTMQAALRAAQPAWAIDDAIQSTCMCEGVTPMPPEFQLKHPRRVRCSGSLKQPDGSTAHYSGYRKLTQEDEDWYRLSDPENGLHPDDLKAFRASIREPAAGFFAWLKFRP